jgi:hypothetical protein
MRSVVPVAAPALLIALVIVTCPTRALSASFDDKHQDAQSIAALETKASQASPREQCFLYAELVHALIEYSTEQYAAGEYQKAAETLKRVNGFAQKIHIAVANDEKRLKNAQILLRHTAYRLNELLHASDLEDRPLVEQTLAQVNQIQTETMMQVFRR